jgi:RND family efflux transporter MFP subunit
MASGPADQRRQPRERLLLWLTLVTALLASGCSDSAGQTTQKGRPAPRAVTVRVATVQARTVERTVDATGSLLAWQEVVLNTSVPGTVARLLVDLGDRVKSGQVVGEQDRREFELAVEQAEAVTQAAADTLRRTRAQVEAAQAHLQQVRDSRRALEAKLAGARAALAEAQANSERTRMLVEDALVARRELDVARTQNEAARAQHETAQVELVQYPDRVRVAEAQLASEQSAVRVAEAELRRREAEAALARKKLADATLRAPIDGAVARRHVNPGEFLNGNTAVFTIVQSDPLKWSGTVAEHAALQVRPGQIVRLRADTVPGRSFEGQVTRVSPAVDVTSRTALLEARVPNREGLLKPGLFARGVIALRQDPGVAFVPETAVSYFAGITKVFVVADGTARERTVKLGARREGWIEVGEGVKPGETVASSGLGQLQDGGPVTIARAAGPATAPR